MQVILRLLHLINKLFTETTTAFPPIFPALKNGELMMLPLPVDAGATSNQKPIAMTKRLLFFGTFLSVLFLTTFSFVAKAQTTPYEDAGLPNPTVTSDKEDYQPGDIAHITGSGWTLDQQVHIELKETPDYPDVHIYDVNVNEDGTWQIDFPIEWRHVGVTFDVLASGSQTAFLTTCTFTDAVTISLQTGSGPLPRSQSVSADFATSGSQNLGNIIITEAGNAAGTNDILGVTQLVITVSSGYNFVQSGVTATKNVTTAPADIVIGAVTYTNATTITIGITVNGTAKNDVITISGVAVKPVSGNTLPNTGTVSLSWTGTLEGEVSPKSLITLTQVAGAVNKVGFVEQPSNANANATINPSPTVQLQDQFGNSISTNNINISLAISSPGVLTGTTTQKTNNSGIATFDDIKVSPPGTYQLTASSPTLNSATSNSFIISRAPTTLTVNSATGVYGGTVNLSAHLESNGTNLSGKTITFSFNGTVVGNSQTTGSGNATLNNASLLGINVNTYPNGITVSFADETNFSGSSGSASLTVNKRPITITVTSGQTKVYGQSDPVFAYTYTPNPATGTAGLAAGDVFYGALTRAAGENVATSPYNITQGTLSIKNASDVDMLNNYQVTFNGSTFSITKRPITITVASGQTKIYGESDPVFSYTYTPNPATSGAGLATGDVFYGALTRVSGENVATSPYNITQGTLSIKNAADADMLNNYQVTFNGSTFSITKRSITITVTSGQTKVYGQSDPTFAYTYTPNPATSGAGLATGDVFYGALTRVSGENVATSPYNITQGTLSIKNAADADMLNNYQVTFNGSTFSITVRPITISVIAGQTKVYGQSDPVFAYTYTPNPATSVAGLASGDVFYGALTRVAGESVASSPYTISQGTLSIKNAANVDMLDNYQVTFNGSTFSITKRAITITVTAGQTKVYGQNDPTFAYTYTPNPASTSAGLASGDVFYGALTRVSGEDVASSPYTISQGTLSIKDALDVDMIDNYQVTFNGSTFSITKRPITINVTAGQTKIYGQSDPTFAYTYSPNPATSGAGLAPGDAFDGALTRVAGENVSSSPYNITQGTLKILNLADEDMLGNYQVTFNGSTFSITKRPITITVTAGQTKIYGQSDPTFAYTYTPNPATSGAGLAPGDAFDGELARVAGENVASSPYNITQGTLKILNLADEDMLGNYQVTFNGSTFSITTRPITITVTAGQTKIYGQSDPTFAYTYTPNPATSGAGLAPGDAFDGALSRVAGENVAFSPYNITRGSLTILNAADEDMYDNYYVTFNGSTFSITKRPITISVTAGQTKVYGQSDPTFAYTYTPNPATSGAGLASGDVFYGALTRALGEDVATSPYTISQGTLSIKNAANADMLGNYQVTFNGSTFSITKRPICITVTTGQFKYYGQDDPVFAYTATAFSNTPPQGLAPGDAFDGALTRDAGNDKGTYSITIGTLTIKKGSTDVSANYTITFKGTTFEIKAVSVTSGVTVSPSTQQYSDLVTFTATITGGAPKYLNGPQAAASATFKIGTQVMGTANFVVSGADIVATLSDVALLETVAGELAPSTTAKIVTACINSPNSNFGISNLKPTTNLTISQENARITYTGPMCVATTGTATTANVTLSATIQDITAYNSASDANAGDIRKATVTIYVDGTAVGTPTIGLVSSGDSKTGTVVLTNITLSITGSPHTICIKVGGYYVTSESFVVTVYQATGDFITGGGYLTLTNSSGLRAGDAGTKNNFGFNVKYNKGGTNLQGNINIIFRRTESGVLKTYQIKGNSMTSLSCKPATTTSVSTPSYATFNSKASIQDITNPFAPISVDGGASLQVKMSDAGEPGKDDQIGIIVYNKSGGVWFSSNWSGTETVNQILGGGNLVVHGSAVGQTTSSPSLVDESTRIDMSSAPGTFKVRAFPNPTTHLFTIDVQSASNEPIEVKVFDITGHMVYYRKGLLKEEHHRFGQMLTDGMYMLNVKQGDKQQTITIIKK